MYDSKAWSAVNYKKRWRVPQAATSANRGADMGKRVWVIGLMLALAGCTHYWAKPGGTPAEFDATIAACESWAYQLLPMTVEQVQLSPGYVTPLSSVCEPYGRGGACYPTGGTYVPPNYGSVDRNGRARDYAIAACLNDAGWVIVDSRAEAEAITSSGSGR
jgi:hypothetical protein